MNPKNVYFTLFLALALLVFLVFRIRNEPKAKELFDRTPRSLVYTKHARCRMNCRQISESEIGEIIRKGIIHMNKTNLRDKPCPTFAVQGRTSSGEQIRVILAQCSNNTKVITCYNLEEDFACDCPGDKKKKDR